jgi:hypothetical protein
MGTQILCEMGSKQYAKDNSPMPFVPEICISSLYYSNTRKVTLFELSPCISRLGGVVVRLPHLNAEKTTQKRIISYII